MELGGLFLRAKFFHIYFRRFRKQSSFCGGIFVGGMKVLGEMSYAFLGNIFIWKDAGFSFLKGNFRKIIRATQEPNHDFVGCQIIADEELSIVLFCLFGLLRSRP